MYLHDDDRGYSMFGDTDRYLGTYEQVDIVICDEIFSQYGPDGPKLKVARVKDHEYCSPFGIWSKAVPESRSIQDITDFLYWIPKDQKVTIGQLNFTYFLIIFRSRNKDMYEHIHELKHINTRMCNIFLKDYKRHKLVRSVFEIYPEEG